MDRMRQRALEVRSRLGPDSGLTYRSEHDWHAEYRRLWDASCTGKVYIHLDARVAGVDLPESLVGQRVPSFSVDATHRSNSTLAMKPSLRH